MACFAFLIKHPLGEFIGIIVAKTASEALWRAGDAWGLTSSITPIDADQLASMTRAGGRPVFTCGS